MAKASRDKGLNRSFKIDRSKVDREKRTVELAFSSEEPVERWGENEVLSHEKGEYDFSRIAAGDHPLLLGHNEHDPLSQIGVVESAWVDDDKVGRAVVRFSESPLGEQILKDVETGIRKLVSVGYDRTGIVNSKKASNGAVTTRYRWQPSHIAIVPVPADTTVGVGRSKKRQCADCDGTGRCADCGGDGMREDGDEDDPCETCGGSGTCPDCRGKGYFTSAKSKLQDANAEILRSLKLKNEIIRSVDSLPITDAEQLFQNLTPEKRNTMKTMLDANPSNGGGGTGTIDEARIKADAHQAGMAAYRERLKKIREIGDALIKERPDTKDTVRALMVEAETSDISIGDWQIRALQEVVKAKPAKELRMAEMGYDEVERDSYSIVRAVQNCVIRNERTPDPDTLEGDVHVKMMKRNIGVQPNGFWVPAEAKISQRSMSRAERRRMQRDLQVQVFAQGGAAVATELITPIIEILRNRMITADLGVRVMAGLEGNVVIPRQTGAGTAYSVGEIAGLTSSTQALDQIPLSPKRVGTTGNYSKQLVLQSSIDVESFMRDDFMKIIAIDWDRIIINGQGANSEALGIMQTPGVGSVTFGGSATWANLISFWTQIAAANADVGEMAYATTPTAAGKLQSIAKLLTGATTVAAYPLWEGNGTNGMINNYRAVATNQIPNNQMIFGVWTEVIHALWGGYDVVVDPFTLAKNGEVVITINTWGDVAIRHPQCFTVSTDAANQ